MFSKLSDKKLHLNSLSNQRKRKKQPPARFCDPEQIAKKSKVEASFIHFSKEHHRSKQHDSKSDQKSINQPNRKSTNKLQDVKSIVCTNEIKPPKTVHEDVTRKFQCEPEQIAKKAKVPKNLIIPEVQQSNSQKPKSDQKLVNADNEESDVKENVTGTIYI